jgi:hypothetical protein
MKWAACRGGTVRRDPSKALALLFCSNATETPQVQRSPKVGPAQRRGMMPPRPIVQALNAAWPDRASCTSSLYSALGETGFPRFCRLAIRIAVATAASLLDTSRSCTGTTLAPIATPPTKSAATPAATYQPWIVEGCVAIALRSFLGPTSPAFGILC